MMTDEMRLFEAQYEELARDYYVADIVPPTARFVFLLESPHVQELRYRAPVSGASGATMSKHLFGERYARIPIGIMLRKNRDEQLHRPSLDAIGLMNVCNIPMQSGAYGNPAVVRRHLEFLRILEGIRSNNQQQVYRDPAWNAVQEMLAARLRDKLEALADRRLVIVPCGRFAQKFFALAGVRGAEWTVVEGVPHPSYNSWDRPQYAAVIGRLKALWEADRSQWLA
jgi:hypothetical protein